MRFPQSVSKSLQTRIYAMGTAVRWWGLCMQAKRAGARHVGGIKTFTAHDELAALYDLAKALPDNAVVLEVGSYLGASACMLGLAMRGGRGRIVCVDTWNNETMPEGILDTLAAFRDNTLAFRDMISVVRKRSVDIGLQDVPGPVDLAFIDGDHSFEGVKADIARVVPLMAPAGVIAFHDAAGGCFPGVSRALGELLAEGRFVFMGATRTLAWVKGVPEGS